MNKNWFIIMAIILGLLIALVSGMEWQKQTYQAELDKNTSLKNAYALGYTDTLIMIANQGVIEWTDNNGLLHRVWDENVLLAQVQKELAANKEATK